MDDTHFLLVKFIDSRNCFLQVQRKLLFNQPFCLLKVIIGGQSNRPSYFTAIGHDGNSEVIHFPQVLGNQLGLNNGSLVSVKFIKEKAPECRHCYLSLIEPRGIGIDGYQEEMTNNILEQIRVVYPGLVFPFWTSSNDVFFFKVDQVSPSVGFSVIVQDSLVEIGRDRTQGSLKGAAYKFMGFIPFFNSKSSNDGEDIVDSAIVNSISCKKIDGDPLKSILSISPSPVDLDTNSTLNTIWVNPKQFNLLPDEFGVLILSKLLPPCEKSKKIGQKKSLETLKRSDVIDSNEEDLFLNTYTLVRSNPICPISCAYASDNLRKQCDLSYNCKIFFRRPKSRFHDSTDSCLKIPMKESLYFCPIGVQTTLSPESIRVSLKEYIKTHEVLILCRGSCIDVAGQSFIVSCDSEDSCAPISKKILEKIEIQVKGISFSRITTSWGKRLPLMKLPEESGNEIQSDQLTVYLPYPFIPWMEAELQVACKFLNRILDPVDSAKVNTSFARQVLLVHGPKGSGKTCFLKHVIKTTKKKYPSVSVKTIQCGSWKTISSLKKQWITQIAECIFSQPSILIFEGLDLVAPHISRVEEIPGADTIASIRASYIFSSIIKSFDELNVRFGQRIAIVATCTSQSSLNQLLVALKGRNIFSESICLENPDLEQRKQIIKSFLNHHGGSISSNPSWLDQISYRCEGYLIVDLLNLVDSAIHNKVTLNQCEEIGSENFEESLQLFRPTMMTDIRIEKSNGISFKDVGGLMDVKNLLRNTLLLPLKYPMLFSKCPIRPPRNILLYGAPGTGKSLIAEALASESKVNLIKIRGPELLSKYIGRSEESIRELFDRAAIAKPCIIFFDEFESLAPRRGQDTTGVTDRVVNQLLAQMDGVEVIERGVYAIAATSRPDLLDPALLRPGRFDKYICCDFPSDDDRLDIWKVLGKDLNFNDNFNHDIIPKLTVNFTGADIRALLINSQYEAIEEFERKYSSDSSIDTRTIKINEEHVLSAKSKTKPCIDSGKRAEYRYIYNKFSGIETVSLPMNQKATLA